jgi:hypothetical protein
MLWPLILFNSSLAFSFTDQTVAEVKGEDEVVKALSCHALFSNNIS